MFGKSNQAALHNYEMVINRSVGDGLYECLWTDHKSIFRSHVFHRSLLTEYDEDVATQLEEYDEENPPVG
ncbi:hypothetical protein VN12_16730 [Pirellula sp. SH-Sr6A]|nr:hypothetical protein VN12_16730 [Pirellula sp. SH-Sr6A]